MLVDTFTDIAIIRTPHLIIVTLRRCHTGIAFFVADVRRRTFFIGGIHVVQAVFDVSILTAIGRGFTCFRDTFVVVTDFVVATHDVCLDPFSAHADIDASEGFVAFLDAIRTLCVGTAFFF